MTASPCRRTAKKATFWAVNAAHLHIILVHVPVVLVPFGCLLLALGRLRSAPALVSVALWTVVTAAVSALPAFLLGEGAEEIVECLPGVSKKLISEHEEAADIAFWLTVIAGLFSLWALFAVRSAVSWGGRILSATLLISLAASGALAYAAQEGGKIRHPEAYDSAQINEGGEGVSG